MRVLHTESSRNWGGQEYRILEQMRWLADQGHFALLAARPDSDIMDRAQAMGLQTVGIEFTGHYNLRAVMALRRAVRRNRIELIDTHGSRDGMAALFARDLCPVVRSRHLSINVKAKWRRRLEWRLGADTVIATAQCIADHLLQRRLVRPDRVTVVGEWADDPFFDRMARTNDRIDVRAEFGVAEGEWLIGSIGMLRGDKGQEFFLRAIAELRRRGHAVRGLVIGCSTKDGSAYERSLHRLAEELGITQAVTFAGYREDIARLTRGLELVLLTSIGVEAQSRIVPQCFAAGTPVVASRVGGVPELVEDGRTGRLVECRDWQAYADASEILLGDAGACAAMVAAARIEAEAEMRLGSKMELTLDTYRRTIARRA